MLSKASVTTQGARGKYRAELYNEKRSDHVACTVPLCDTDDMACKLTPWFEDGETAFNQVSSILKEKGKILFVPMHMQRAMKFLPGPRVYLVERLTGGMLSKHFLVNQLAYKDQVGAAMMRTTLNAKPLGMFFPYDSSLETGEYTFLLRKNGLGGQLFRERPWDRKETPYVEILDDLEADPTGKYSQNLLKKLIGG
nr:nsp1 [Tylonycteris bat coronavirus HKU4]YP_009944325.1 nsp1 [Tylonycteris bat coronavirus HKU4]